MAMASENSARGQPKVSCTGIWNTPKLARSEKLISRMIQPPIRIGVISFDDCDMTENSASVAQLWASVPGRSSAAVSRLAAGRGPA